MSTANVERGAIRRDANVDTRLTMPQRHLPAARDQDA
jgi:hypothetical protein